LTHEKLRKVKSVENIKEEVDRIFHLIKIEDFKTEIQQEIEYYLSNQDYKTLLKYCNLKEEISIGLSRDKLFPEYPDYAMATIMNNNEIHKLLKESYLPNLE